MWQGVIQALTGCYYPYATKGLTDFKLLDMIRYQRVITLSYSNTDD